MKRDGYLELELTPDKTQAFVTLYAPKGDGNPVNTQEVLDALKGRGVMYGYRDKEISQAVKCVIDDDQPPVRILAAQGVLPEDGKDAQMVWRIDHEAISTPFPVREDGTIDYFQLGSERFVEAGQVLLNIIPARAGTPGKTLTAPLRPVQQSSGKDANITAGPGTRMSDDRTQILAVADGYAEYRRDRITVLGLRKVADLVKGNHEFMGGVIVEGGISGAYLKARGVVAIGGKLQNSTIRSRDDVWLRDAEYAEIIADGNVYVLGSLFNCEVFCRKKVISMPGTRIAGGSIYATEGVDAQELGDARLLPLHVVVGHDRVSEFRMGEVEQEVVASEANIRRISAVLRPFNSQLSESLPKEKRQMVQQLSDQRKQLENYVRELHGEKRVLAMSSRNLVEAEVRVRGTAHPGIQITIKHATLQMRSAETEVLFKEDSTGKTVSVSAILPEAA